MNRVYLSIRWFDSTCRHFFKINVDGVHLEYYSNGKIMTPTSEAETLGSGQSNNDRASSSTKKIKFSRKSFGSKGIQWLLSHLYTVCYSVCVITCTCTLYVCKMIGTFVHVYTCNIRSSIIQCTYMYMWIVHILAHCTCTYCMFVWATVDHHALLYIYHVHCCKMWVEHIFFVGNQ